MTLTDYHVHLRPDEPGTDASAYFTERNVARYVERAREQGIGELGFSEHVYRFREALAVWRHPFWVESAVDGLDAYVEFLVEMRAAGYPVKVGLELDYVPGRESELAALLDGPAVRLRDRLGAFHRRPRGRPRGLRRMARVGAGGGLAGVLRDRRRWPRRAGSSTCSRTSTL